MMTITSTGAANGAVLCPLEARLVAAYRAAADDARSDLIIVAECFARASPRVRRHPLALVHSNDSTEAR
jgi:hypothetical protein